MNIGVFSRRRLMGFVCAALITVTGAATSPAQITSFTYQGKLSDSGSPANGSYDLLFTLWDSLSGGAQIGSTQAASAVSVSNGVFTVTLDFGAGAFNGANRFLEIGARTAGGGSFTILTPRQQITSTPYAIRSLNATSADGATTAANATQLGGVAASQYVQTNDSRLSDARPPTAGSSNYIQNTTTPQASSNFFISGNGTAGTLNGNVVSATTQYNLGGSPVLSSVFGCPGCVLLGGPGDSTFRVGINTSFPTFTLDVKSSGVAVSGNTTGTGPGVEGVSQAANGAGVEAVANQPGGTAVRAFGTSFFSGDTTPLADFQGAGVAIGFINTGTVGGYVFGYDYAAHSARNLILNGPGGNVGIGITNPDQALTVNGRARIASIPALGTPAGTVCFDVPGNLINCTASSLRYKTNVHPFAGGLEIVRRLRPINFEWKDSGLPDVGLGAEDVAKVAPSFTFRNGKGEVDGVRYDRLNIVLINAVNEQQTQIEQQQAQLKQQQVQIERLEKQMKTLQATSVRHNMRRRSKHP